MISYPLPPPKWDPMGREEKVGCVIEGLTVVLLLGVLVWLIPPAAKFTDRANAACRDHGGIQSVQDRVLCRDGILVEP